MKNSTFKEYVDFVIVILLGVGFGYFAANIIGYKISGYRNYITFEKMQSKNNQIGVGMVKTIISNNIMGIRVGERIPLAKANVEVVSSINGYRLVGFVSGINPMALLKKSNKPVVIVTKKEGLDNIWVLDKIEPDGVYLKNRKTDEVKKFAFVRNGSNIGMLEGDTYLNSIESGNVLRVTVNRNIVDKISNINVLLRQINIVPVFAGGKTVGYRISYLSPVSVLRRIGLRPGDIIVSVNGESTANPNKIMELYSQLRDMTSVTVNIIRRGVKKTIFVRIK